jgi:hypothetical protein
VSLTTILVCGTHSPMLDFRRLRKIKGTTFLRLQKCYHVITSAHAFHV